MYAPAARKIKGREVRLKEHTEYGERGYRDKEKKRDDKERGKEHLFTLTNQSVRVRACSYT